LRHFDIDSNNDNIITYFYNGADSWKQDDSISQKKEEDEIYKVVKGTPIPVSYLYKENKPVKFVKGVNETSLQFSLNYKLMFADVQDYKLYKSSIDTKKERFANAGELIDYQ